MRTVGNVLHELEDDIMRERTTVDRTVIKCNEIVEVLEHFVSQCTPLCIPNESEASSLVAYNANVSIRHLEVSKKLEANQNSNEKQNETHKAFIQQRAYFLETTRDNIVSTINSGFEQPYSFTWDQFTIKPPETTIDMAIMFQQKSHIVSNLCFGLLGGISLMQLVLTYTLVKGSKYELISFIELYSKFGYVPSALFSSLTTLCFVFSFDRLDPLRIRKMVSREENWFYCNWLLVLLYGATFVLSMLCFQYDELISVYPNSKDVLHVSHDLWMWKILNMWRCILGIIGWFFVSITRPYDLLEHRLCSLRNDANNRDRKFNR